MHARHLLITVLLLVAASSGCHTGPYVNSHLETVNAEYRQLEDYVYSLEDENTRLQRELDACIAGRPAPGAAAPGGDRGLFRRRSRMTPADETPGLSPPTIDPGSRESESGDPPVIKVPDVPSETPPRRSTLNRPAGDAPSEKLDLEPPSVEVPNIELPPPTGEKPASQKPDAPSAPEPIPPAKPSDTKISHLFLSPIMTGGTDLDGRPGDDGLTVVIEPRNAAGQYVPEAGAVSVVVLDPSKAGESARVARWNFDASQTREKLQTGSAARGIQLQMPWPATPPASEKLHLFVRYTAADGRQLQTDREIFMTPSGQVSERWTPRPIERQRPAAAEAPQIAQQDRPAPLPASKAAPDLLTPPAWSPYR